VAKYSRLLPPTIKLHVRSIKNNSVPKNFPCVLRINRAGIYQYQHGGAEGRAAAKLDVCSACANGSILHADACWKLRCNKSSGKPHGLPLLSPAACNAEPVFNPQNETLIDVRFEKFRVWRAECCNPKINKSETGCKSRLRAAQPKQASSKRDPQAVHVAVCQHNVTDVKSGSYVDTVSSHWMRLFLGRVVFDIILYCNSIARRRP
jgi:hypothetical protein